MQNDRLKVLIVAHEFSPYQGSECAIGWNFVNCIAKYHDVTVIFATRYKEAIRKYLDLHGKINGIEFIDVDDPGTGRFLKSINRIFSKIGPIGFPVIYYMAYNKWQGEVARKITELRRVKAYDLVHHITQLTFRSPGYSWKSDLPFFWGPTGGTSILPLRYFGILSPASRILEFVRTISNYYQMNFSWNVIRARKKASVIYAFSNEDMAYLSRNTKADIRLMLDVGTYPDQFTPKDKHPKGSVVKAIWCGQLAYRKAPVILLKALAKSITTREDLQIQIIGEGPLEQELIVIANELGLKNIEWIKNVAHKEVFSLMCKADFLIHTSLREATSSVIPEALSVGLPVICHDVNGMSVAVNESCGIKVPMISPEESIDRFHDAMIRLIQDRELLNRLQLGAINRAKELSWERNAEIIANDYLRIVNSQE